MSFRVAVCLPVSMVLLVTAASAPAAAETGFYVGATAGESVFQGQKSEFDAEVADTWAAINTELGPNSISVTPQSSSLQKAHFAVGGLIGYRFMPQLAIEAAYIDLGQLHYRSNGTMTYDSPYGLHMLEPEIGVATIKARGPTLTALGILPLSPALEIYGRAGVLFSRVSVSKWVSLDIGPMPASAFGAASGAIIEEGRGHSVDPLVGAGVAWHLPWHITLRGEYTRFIDVGDKNSTGEINIDLFNVGVTYSIR